MKKALFFFATLLILCCATQVQAQTKQNAKADEVKVMTIKVSGVCCNGDLGSLKKKLVNQEGIDEVSANEANKAGTHFKITYHPSLISEQAIRNVIEKSEGCESGESPYKVKTVSYLSQK
jgi:copper chaperone CopZ